MLISGRQAAEVLSEVGLSRSQTRQVLSAGLAGMPVVTRGAHLYPEEAVLELARRPQMTNDEVAEACPKLLFVARRWVDVLASHEDQLEAVSRRWDLGARGSNIVLTVHLGVRGPIPFVATVCGFVVLGGDLRRMVRESGGGPYRMELEAPGEWFSAFRNRRLHFGPGRDFVLRGW